MPPESRRETALEAARLAKQAADAAHEVALQNAKNMEFLQRYVGKRLDIVEGTDTEWRTWVKGAIEGVSEKLGDLKTEMREANNRCTRHQEELFGQGDKKGLINRVDKLDDGRKYVISAFAILLLLPVGLWSMVGNSVMKKLVNPTYHELAKVIDSRIRWWFPDKKAPAGAVVDPIVEPDNG